MEQLLNKNNNFPNDFQSSMNRELVLRANRNALRNVTPKGLSTKWDFCSNDYLGLSQNSRPFPTEREFSLRGSTGSRLLTGSYSLINEFEDDLAQFFKGPKGLFFNSGYLLNCGLLPTLAKENDLIIMDRSVHTSLKNGAKLSGAKRLFFRHNDLSHLEKRLVQNQNFSGNKFIVIESLYSMEGDFCPLNEIVTLAQKYGAEVILDEAHSTGIIGPQGEGLAVSLGLEDSLLARIHTFGKAWGQTGALVIGSEVLIKYVINFCHSFIYTTAPSPIQIEILRHNFNYLKENITSLSHLQKNIKLFAKELEISDWGLSPLFFFKGSGPNDIKKLCEKLAAIGPKVLPILSPTVKKGEEGVRVCLHSFNRPQEIKILAKFIIESELILPKGNLK